MQKETPVTISKEEFRAMSEKLLLPTGQEDTDEAVRAKVELWYQQMLPFAEKMADFKYDDVAPAIVTVVR